MWPAWLRSQLSLRVAFGVLAFAALAAYLAATVDAIQLLPIDVVFHAVDTGSTAGWPVGTFYRTFLPFALVPLAAGLIALRGTETTLGRITLTPLRRAAIAIAPIGATFFSLWQDDIVRRGPIIALALGISALLTVVLGSTRDDTGAQRGTDAHSSIERPFRRLIVHAPILGVIVAHAALFTYLTVRRDQALWSATVDLGIFKEALWNTLHGRLLFSPTVGYSFFGEHFSPVLLLLVPLYALSPSSVTLLAVQACAVSLAAWPLYRLGLRQGLGRTLATAIAASAIFAPPMQHALLYDFHMDLLGVPCLAWAILAADERKWWKLAIAAALLCTVKEEAFVSMTGLAIAMYLGDRERRKLPSAVLGVTVLLYCAIAITVFIHRFGPPHGVPTYMGGDEHGYKFLRNFRHFGRTPAVFFQKPLRFVFWMFTDERLTTLFVLFAPLLVAPIFAGPYLFLMTPLAILLLSDNIDVERMNYHYGAMQIPGVAAAGIYGMHRWLARAGQGRAVTWRLALAAGVLVASIVMIRLQNGSEWSISNESDQRHVTARSRRVREMARQVPADVYVSSSTFGGPMFSNRWQTAMFPQHLDLAQWAYVDLQRPPWPASAEERDDNVLRMLRTDWSAVAWVDGAIVMMHGGDHSRNLAAVSELFIHRRFEVEGTEQTEYPHSIVADRNASDGYARRAAPTNRRAGTWVISGPAIRVLAGRYHAIFRLRAEPTWFRGDIGSVSVYAGGNAIATRSLLNDDFPDAAWQDIELEFHSDGTGALEFRVATGRSWVLDADRISIEPLDHDDTILRLAAFAVAPGT